MAVLPADDPARALAQRLRDLREQEFPDVPITQRQLAGALRVSVPLISSWESTTRPVTPPEERLDAYATLFASRRTVEQAPLRLPRLAELTDDERARREQLRHDLLAARAAVTDRREEGVPVEEPVIEPLRGPWSFHDARPITLVCAELPEAQRARLPEPDDPDSAYADLYAFADLDALFELHGHIRAANPTSLVTFRTSTDLHPDDYTTHLVVLGGVDWNRATRNLLRYVPVAQLSGGQAGAYFDVEDGDQHRRLSAEVAEDGSLVADAGHFYRAPNPYNAKRTVTICNGLSSRGVLGAVRALTDERFRDRNAAYLERRFAGSDSYSILTRILIIDGSVVTPDWTRPDLRLHEWPEAGA
ncbi:MAG: helix-turn-helix domain-containing protein [Micromonosporaceae bacterium]|nr:helix-turn-helix domain-containing protein [Micromonosporaceae bacterium]